MATNDFTSSISVTSTNKFSGQYVVFAVDKNDLNASIVPRLASQLPSSIFVNPQNHFSLIVDVQQPPRIKVNLTPVRDATVRESIPRFNYGAQQDMYIGYSTSLSERYRSFLGFDIAQVPSGKIIDSAILKIYHDKYSTPLEMIDISQATEDWTEQGITWSNQPTLNTLVSSQSVDQINGYLQVDITNLVKGWYDGSIYNNGIALRAHDESIQSLIHMYTRESAYPPILEVTYIETYNPSFGHIDLSSTITPRLNITQDLSSSVTIYSTWNKVDTPASLTVNLPWQISGSILISRPNMQGVIITRQSDTNQINSSMTVRDSSFLDISASTLVSQPNLFSSVIVRKSDKNDLLSSIEVRQSITNDLTSFIIPSFPNLSGSINVNQKSDLQGSITVQIEINDNSQISGSIGVYPYLQGSVNVKQINQIPASVQVITRSTKNLNSAISVRRSTSNDLSTSISAKQWNQLQSSVVVSTGWLSASLRVPIQDYRDKSANLKVRVSFLSDLTSTINVKKQKVYVFFM